MELEFAQDFGRVPKAEWDALLAPEDHPLLSWGFLSLLEASGSMTAEKGWQAAPILVREEGRLVAAAPFYIRSHSMGDFVFDFAFADYAESRGLSWYPKLVGVIPATPAPAWKILLHPELRGGEKGDALSKTILEAAIEAAREGGLAGLHILWPEADTARLLSTDRRFLRWEHQSFLWRDSGYGDFQGYLDAFSKNMRRNVHRERDKARAEGISTRIVEPDEAAAHPAILETMADFYESHNEKFGPWAAKFLERDFFLGLPERLPEGWCLSAAYEKGQSLETGDPPIALAFLLRGKRRLYGRFWGARREVDCLHFELCYYLPIEYALGRGIESFDPGMGSPHKARRGFASQSAPSFHLPFQPSLYNVMGRSLKAANIDELAMIDELNAQLPFKAKAP